MENFTFEKVEDDNDRLKFTVRGADGSVKEISTTKLMTGCLPLNAEEKRRIALRDFDLNKSQSLVFKLSGGVGDLVMQLEALLGLKEYLAKNSKSKFQFFARLYPPLTRDFCRRFFIHMPIFDDVLDHDDRTEFKFAFPTTTMDSRCINTFHADDISLGNSTNYYWARWGLPGNAPAEKSRKFVDGFSKPAKADLEFLAKMVPGFSPNEDYLLFCPEAISLSEKKSWPLSHWLELIRNVSTHESGKVVILGAREKYVSLAIDERRIIFVDPKNSELCSDLWRLISIVQGARLVVGIDSGPAHIAGFLGKACIVLWGPTNPVTLGHPSNINLRLSTCAPCIRGVRARLCQENVCMKEIDSDIVSEIVRRSLAL